MIVSVIMITYGHERFIQKSIEGVLMQKCNFDFELIIANDCSPDSTHKIISELICSHPKGHLIKYTRHKKNLGPVKNSIWALNQSNAKFISLCEGDDYWTSPDKIQNQVDFLNNNNDFSICFTDYKVLYENTKNIFCPNLNKKYKNKSIFNQSNIILSNFIPTATVMFRNQKEVFTRLDLSLYPLDWFLHILNSEYGKIKFLSFESAVYREHDGGICSATSPIINNQKYLKSIKIFRKVYSKNYKVQFLFNIMVIKMRLQNLNLKIFR
jgi:glycosyltransferase involved in cell wall biosynthesis